MIKLKKLIPFVSALGIIPIAMVSCAKYDYVSWSKGQEFKPSIEKYQPEPDSIHTFAEAGYVFRDLAKHNPKIISEAIVEKVALDEESGTYEEERKIDKFSIAVNKVGFSNPSQRVDDPYVEGKMSFSATITGEINVVILNVNQTIKLNDVHINIGEISIAMRYDDTQVEHPFLLKLWDRDTPRSGVNAPFFEWQNGKIVVQENRNWSYYDINDNPVTAPVLSKLMDICCFGQLSYFDNVKWEE